MNVLTITANDNGLGGASRIALEGHRSYAAAGHQVSMLTGKKTSAVPEISEIRRPLWRKALSYLLSNDFELFSGRQILDSRQFKEADVVHCHNLNGWYFNLTVLAEMSRRKPVVWTLHDMWAITPHSAHTNSREQFHGLLALSDPSLYPSTLWNNDRRLARRKSQLYAEMNAHIVSPCRWLASLVSQTTLGMQPLSVIYNGTDLSTFVRQDRSLARSQLGLGPGPIVLFVGAAATSNQFKGYVDFEWLATSERKKPAQFLCLGADEDATASGVRLIKATRDRERIAAYMAAADVLVLPSRHEVLPTVIIEAMAAGTPTVAYDVGGVPEMLGRVTGNVVVPALDREGLRVAMLEVIDRAPTQQQEISHTLKTHAQATYSVARMAREYLELFERLVQQRKALSI